MYHKLFAIKYPENSSSLHVLMSMGPENGASESTNGILVYGYIDRECGFSFYMLSFAVITDNRIIMQQRDPSASIRLRYGAVKEYEAFFNLDEKYVNFFNEETEEIDKNYCASEDVEMLRTDERFSILDEFRSPEYPDDVIVFFIDQESEKIEGCWVRLNEFDGNGWLYGELLNNPWHDFGVSSGDFIRFRVTYIAQNTVKLIYHDNLL